MKTTHQIIADYKAAYRHANGHDKEVSYCAGWYTVGNYNKLRRADMLKATMTLLARPAWEPEA